MCLENTHNRCSGRVLTPEYTDAIADMAHRRDAAVHLDGARIFNAAVHLGLPPAELVRSVDSVMFCFSKGLSCPVGSIVCGPRDFIERAHRNRNMLGGGMRQAGVLAAAALVALEEMTERLAEDHANARRLAEGLSRIPGVLIDPTTIQTNIVILELADGDAPGFLREAEARGPAGLPPPRLAGAVCDPLRHWAGGRRRRAGRCGLRDEGAGGRPAVARAVLPHLIGLCMALLAVPYCRHSGGSRNPGVEVPLMVSLSNHERGTLVLRHPL